MNQRHYTQSLLKRYGLSQAKIVKATAVNYDKLVKNGVNKTITLWKAPSQYQHVMSIITHYYSNILKSSRDNNKKNEVTSGLWVYKVPRVLFKPAFYLLSQRFSRRNRLRAKDRRCLIQNLRTLNPYSRSCWELSLPSRRKFLN